MNVLFSPKDGRIYTGKLPLFLDGNLAQPYFTFEVGCLAHCRCWLVQLQHVCDMLPSCELLQSRWSTISVRISS